MSFPCLLNITNNDHSHRHTGKYTFFSGKPALVGCQYWYSVIIGAEFLYGLIHYWYQPGSHSLDGYFSGNLGR